MIAEAILSYHLICSAAFNTDTEWNEVEEKVTQYINEGWQPYGSISINNIMICQPMVKYKG